MCAPSREGREQVGGDPDARSAKHIRACAPVPTIRGARPKSMVIRPGEEAHRVDSPEQRELGTDFPPGEIEKAASRGGGRRCGERWNEETCSCLWWQ
jgi:hypothetical protein